MYERERQPITLFLEIDGDGEVDLKARDVTGYTRFIISITTGGKIKRGEGVANTLVLEVDANGCIVCEE